MGGETGDPFGVHDMTIVASDEARGLPAGARLETPASRSGGLRLSL